MSVAYFVKQVDKDEKIKKIIYRSLASYTPTLLVSFICIWGGLFSYFWILSKIQRLGHVVVWLVLFIGIVLFMRVLMRLKYTAWVITNRRLIDFDQKNFWRNEQSDAPLKDLEDPHMLRLGFVELITGRATLRVVDKNDQAVLELRGVRRAKKHIAWLKKHLPRELVKQD